MIIYIEKQARHYPQTQKILEKYKNAQYVFIDNYKNIFDKNITNLSIQKSLIVAKLNSPAITDAPPGYGHSNSAYFFKTSLNCIFDCSYCYLKGLFKNENMVVFVNDTDIQSQISDKIDSLITQDNQTHWFYSGDYSDVIGMDVFSGFCTSYIGFFEQFDEQKVMMEIRTKSAYIQPILDLGFIPKNTEISFSLNPQELIQKYETGTSALDARITAINTLLEKGYKVGIRFLPLLPVKNYETMYAEFVDYISKQINMCQIYSTFASGLLYTKRDYKKILSKYPDLDILHMLDLENDDFYRESKQIRTKLYDLFKKLDNKCIFCLEN